FSIARLNRAPLDCLAVRERLWLAACRAHAPEVAAIDVILIRSVDDPALIRTQPYVLHVKIPRREELRRAAANSNRVQVVPTVFLPVENDAACIRELQRLKRKQGQRIFHRFAAVKELTAFAALRVCDPKRPRSRELRNERPFEFGSGLANKHNLFAVR